MTHRLLAALTVANLGVLLFVVLTLAGQAPAGEDIAVLRGRALEIVDEDGRVRASIRMHPAEAGYPETVMLRLIDPNGRPEVKIGASAEGGGLSLLGDTDGTQVLLKADGGDTVLRLTNRDGKQQVLKP